MASVRSKFYDDREIKPKGRNTQMQNSLEFLRGAGYCLGRDIKTGLDCYFISESDAFSKSHPDIAASIVNDCQSVQDSVWLKRHSTLENTFAVGNLLLLANSESVLGFVSGRFFPCSENTIAMYLSDGMFLKKIQGQGLLTLVLSIFHDFELRKYGRDFSRFLTIVVSGNIAPFKFFEQLSCFEEMSFTSENQVERSAVVDFVTTNFPHASVIYGEIIQKAWLPQETPTTQVWPAAHAQAIGLPALVNYQAGDALFKCYEFRVDKIDVIQEIIQVRLQSTGEQT